MVSYLKNNNIRLKGDYFSGIIKAVAMVVLDGNTVHYACGICSQLYHDEDMDDGHLNEKIMRKHVKAIVSLLNN